VLPDWIVPATGVGKVTRKDQYTPNITAAPKAF
jgi:hypothetical protein